MLNYVNYLQNNIINCNHLNRLNHFKSLNLFLWHLLPFKGKFLKVHTASKSNRSKYFEKYILA